MCVPGTNLDGTTGNQTGSAAGRAMDRTLGTNTTGANPSGTSAASLRQGTTERNAMQTGLAATNTAIG